MQQAQIAAQVQIAAQAQPTQQPRQPPMTLGDPGQPSHRPRSQPQPPHLIIPGQQQQQQRSVSASGLIQQQQISQQVAVNPTLPHQPVDSPGLQIQPPPESARSTPHSHMSQDKQLERSTPTPPPVVSVSPSPAQKAQFPKRSDSLYSQSRFHDSRSSSPTVQRPDRSDSLSSLREQQQRVARSDSLSRSQMTQQIPARADLPTSPSSVLPDGLTSSLSTHPQNAPGGLGLVSSPPAPETRYAGERRGQNAFAPREEPEEPQQQPHQLQQVSTPMMRSASDQPPPNTQGGAHPGIIRSQTGFMGSHPESHQGNEQQRGLVQEQQEQKAPPQFTTQRSGIGSDDDDLYSPPPPKIQMQQPSPPRGPPGTGQQFSPQQYQQGYYNGHPANYPPQGLANRSPEPQQQLSGDPRRYSGPGGPGQGPPQMGPIGQQMIPQGPYQRQFAPGDPRNQPQHPGQQQSQPSYQGPPGTQPTSYGPPPQGPPEPSVRRTSSGLMKTLSGVSAHSGSHSGSTQYATSTTSSQEKRRSSFFENLSTKVGGNNGKGSQQTIVPTSRTQSPDATEPKMVKDAGRRTSFMGGKKGKGSGSKEKKEKGEKSGKSSHKKGFSIVSLIILPLIRYVTNSPSRMYLEGLLPCLENSQSHHHLLQAASTHLRHSLHRNNSSSARCNRNGCLVNLVGSSKDHPIKVHLLKV